MALKENQRLENAKINVEEADTCHCRDDEYLRGPALSMHRERAEV